jgi:hypothetical protein
MELPGLLLHAYALHDTLANTLQCARQNVGDILEKAYLYNTDAVLGHSTT